MHESKPPRVLLITELLRSVEGALNMVGCLSSNGGGGGNVSSPTCSRSLNMTVHCAQERCRNDNVIQLAPSAVHSVLDSTQGTLEQLSVNCPVNHQPGIPAAEKSGELSESLRSSQNRVNIIFDEDLNG